MKKILSSVLVIAAFVLSTQHGPSVKVYYANDGKETSNISEAMVFGDLGSAYAKQIELGSAWEIVNN